MDRSQCDHDPLILGEFGVCTICGAVTRGLEQFDPDDDEEDDTTDSWPDPGGDDAWKDDGEPVGRV